MGTVFASAVAVAGTLLGVWVSHVLQRRSSHESEDRARAERRRAELVDACSGFAEAVMQLRRAQHARWVGRRRAGEEPVLAEPREEAYRLRATAWHAYFRLKLLCGDEGLLAKATSAVEAAAGMHEARDDAELRSRGETAKRLLDDFVTAAAALLR
ncbi:MAG TPA: hypothetical protein VKY81_10275 [Natronosporangium sp.]|nr:hypothetical protein [Natronosporangium sp.]